MPGNDSCHPAGQHEDPSSGTNHPSPKQPQGGASPLEETENLHDLVSMAQSLKRYMNTLRKKLEHVDEKQAAVQQEIHSLDARILKAASLIDQLLKIKEKKAAFQEVMGTVQALKEECRLAIECESERLLLKAVEFNDKLLEVTKDNAAENDRFWGTVIKLTEEVAAFKSAVLSLKTEKSWLKDFNNGLDFKVEDQGTHEAGMQQASLTTEEHGSSANVSP